MPFAPNYKAKSYIIGGWQWWRDSADCWVTEGGWYVYNTDGGWWLMGNGIERHCSDRGIKFALHVATTDYADTLRTTGDQP